MQVWRAGRAVKKKPYVSSKPCISHLSKSLPTTFRHAIMILGGSDPAGDCNSFGVFSLPTCGLSLNLFSPTHQLYSYKKDYNDDGTDTDEGRFEYDKIIGDVLSLIALAAFLMLVKQKTGLPVELMAPLLMLDNIREWTLIFLAYHILVK